MVAAVEGREPGLALPGLAWLGQREYVSLSVSASVFVSVSVQGKREKRKEGEDEKKRMGRSDSLHIKYKCCTALGRWWCVYGVEEHTISRGWMLPACLPYCVLPICIDM
jgi:hypothetical protein